MPRRWWKRSGVVRRANDYPGGPSSSTSSIEDLLFIKLLFIQSTQRNKAQLGTPPPPIMMTEQEILIHLMQSNQGINCGNKPAVYDEEGNVLELDLLWKRLGPRFNSGIGIPLSVQILTIIFGSFSKIHTFRLSGCPQLAMPEGIISGMSNSLTSLVLKNIPFLCLDIGLLQNLKSLELVNCGTTNQAVILNNLSGHLCKLSIKYLSDSSSSSSRVSQGSVQLEDDTILALQKDMKLLTTLALSGIARTSIQKLFSLHHSCWSTGSMVLREVELINCKIYKKGKVLRWLLEGLPPSLEILRLDSSYRSVLLDNFTKVDNYPQLGGYMC